MDVTVAGGAGLDTSIDHEDDEGQDATTNMISELVSQGAELNATLDKTGETSLHLAARYARADAAKRLLDMGADVNFQDNTGRTPLHAAVAADAMGAFQVSTVPSMITRGNRQITDNVHNRPPFSNRPFLIERRRRLLPFADSAEEQVDKLERENARRNYTVNISRQAGHRGNGGGSDTRGRRYKHTGQQWKDRVALGRVG